MPRRWCELLKGIPAKINLIPFNPWPGTKYECSDWEQIEKFSEIIFNAGYASPVRTPRGRDILAACGQLKSATEKLSARERLALARHGDDGLRPWTASAGCCCASSWCRSAIWPQCWRDVGHRVRLLEDRRRRIAHPDAQAFAIFGLRLRGAGPAGDAAEHDVASGGDRDPALRRPSPPFLDVPRRQWRGLGLVGWNLFGYVDDSRIALNGPLPVIAAGLAGALPIGLIAGWSAGFWKPVFHRRRPRGASGGLTSAGNPLANPRYQMAREAYEGRMQAITEADARTKARALVA